MYLFGILCLVAATGALPFLPDPPTLTNSVAAAHQGSEMQIYNQHRTIASASLQDIKDNDEVKKRLFDYTILKKQKAAQKRKYEDTVKQNCENAKKEIMFVISGNPVKVQLPTNPAALIDSVTTAQDSKLCSNIFIVATDSALIADRKEDEDLKPNRIKIASIAIPAHPVLEDSEGRVNTIHVGTDSAPVAEEKDDEEVEHSMAKIATIVMPSPPELPPFDYSILKQQKADYNLKSEYSAMQATEKSKGKKEVLIVDLEKPVKVEVPANPTTLINSVTTARDSEISALVADKKDDEEVKPNMVKIASIVIPAPPELSVFDYSILEKQLADQKQRSEETLKQEAEKYKKVKELVIIDQEDPVKVRVRPNPATLTGSVPVFEDSEGRVSTIHVGTDSAPVAEEKDDEEVEHSMAKIATIVMPSPPELPPFDYSILKQQKADYNLKSEYSAMQATEKSKGKKEALIVDLEKPVKVEVPANPTTLINSVTTARDSEISALVADKKDDEEVKPNMVKIASIVIPAPPELSVFDYSILEKQLADQKQRSEETLKQEAEKSKKVKELVIIDQEDPVKVRVRPNPATLTGSVPVFEDSEGRVSTIHVGTDSAPVAEEKDDEEVEHSMAKIATIVMPSPPELPPFDYSILKQQKADYNLKSEYSAMQATEKSKGKKEALIVDLEKSVKVEVPANPTTLINSVTTARDSEISALVADKKDDEEVKPNMVKIASIVIPAPPELSVFDYSILEKQLADQKQRSEETLKQEAEKSKKVKELVIIDQEDPVKVRVRPNPATLTGSVPVLEDSEGRVSTIHVGTDSAPVAEEKDDEEVEHSMAKIATVIIPPPPELPPFDYSILRQQNADYHLRSEYFAKQAAEKSKEEKEAIIIDLEKPVNINIRPNPTTLTDFETALQDSEVHANIPNIATDSAQVAEKKNDEEGKYNMVKTATVIIPSPPELLPFDNSILKNHIDEHKQKSDHFLKLEAEKSEKKKDVLIIEEPVEVKEPKLIEESQFIRDCKPIKESKPMEESKLIEVLKKEPVKHLEDIPVIMQWTITSSPLLSKLISNYPPLPSCGLNWPLRRPSKSRHSSIIDPKFNLDGYTYTN